MKTGRSDHRTRVTKMLIRKAFTDLLQTKPIQRISIKELCEMAGINRGTFYTHYTDIYDLLNQIEAEMLADFQQALRPMFDGVTHPLHPVEVSTKIFQCLKDHADICTVTLGDYGDKNFALQLIQLGRETSMEAYSSYFTEATEEEQAYFYAFVSGGCIGLLQKWMAEGLETPAEEIARMADTMMLQGIGFLQKGSRPAER